MKKNGTNILAVLVTDGPGQSHFVHDTFYDFFGHPEDVRISICPDKKRLNVIGQDSDAMDEEQIQMFQRYLSIHKHEIQYEYVAEPLKKTPKRDKLAKRVRMLEKESGIIKIQLSQKNEELQNLQAQFEKVETDANEQLEEFCRLDDRLREAEIKVKTLSDENAAITKDYEVAKTQIPDIPSLHLRALKHLSLYADKLTGVEEQFSSLIYQTGELSIAKLIERANKLPLTDSIRNFNQLNDLIINYRNRNDEETVQIIEERFETLNDDEFRKYQESRSQLESLGKHITGLKKDTLLSDDLREKHLQLFEDSMERIRADRSRYELKKQKFIDKSLEQLESISNDLLKRQTALSEMQTITDSLQTIFPVYIFSEEDPVRYNIRIYLPAKDKNAKLVDILLCDHLLNESINKEFNEEDFQNVELRTNNELNLTYINIPLSKTKYSFEMVKQLQTKLETLINLSFSQSPLHELGVEVEVIQSNRCNSVLPKLEEEEASIESIHFYEGIQTRQMNEKMRRRYEALERVLYKAKEPMIRATIVEEVKKILPFDDITGITIRNILKPLLKHKKISTTGKSPHLKYFLDKKQSAMISGFYELFLPCPLPKIYDGLEKKWSGAYERNILSRMEDILGEAGEKKACTRNELLDRLNDCVQIKPPVSSSLLKAMLQSLEAHSKISVREEGGHKKYFLSDSQNPYIHHGK